MFIWLFRLFCLSWILAVCDFHGIGPFLLLCLIKEHKIVHSISLLSFYLLQDSVVILFKQGNFAKVKCTDLSNTFWWVLTNIYTHLGFPGGSEGKVSACDVGDPGLIPGSGWSPGGGNGTPLQYSCWENPMDKGAWWATVHKVNCLRISDIPWNIRRLLGERQKVQY